jgi:2OG-Fe(II) oxygenase superfamily
LYDLENKVRVVQRGRSLIQLTRKGLVVTGTQADLDSLRTKFAVDNYVILPKLYEPSLLGEILQRVQAARFLPRDHKEVGLELCMADHRTTALLAFLQSNPAFLRIIERITGQAQIGEFSGRVYQMNSSGGHYDNWHSDLADRRVVTMSVNLSPQVYEGGALQLKLRDSTEILQEVRNTGLGDALLFRISADLIHRVQGVTGDHPKIAFAGWFLQGEDLLANLGKRLSPPIQNIAKVANDQPDWEVPVSPERK